MSLYAATVPAFCQTVAAVAGVIDKGAAFAAERGRDPAALIDARLAPDMLPFGFQVKSVAVHSIGAIRGLAVGSVGPDRTPWATDFAGLGALMAATLAELEALTPDDVDRFAGHDIEFRAGERRMAFTAEDFLLSFSLPNFYFHAATAYAVLRVAGVALGKGDFIGRPRLRAA